MKADEPQVGQQHEYVEMKREYYHIIFSLKRLEILHQERRGQVKIIVMQLFNGILFHKSGPANKHHTNHSSLTHICCGAETKDLIVENRKSCLRRCEEFECLLVKIGKEDKQENIRNRIDKGRAITAMLSYVL